MFYESSSQKGCYFLLYGKYIFCTVGGCKGSGCGAAPKGAIGLFCERKLSRDAFPVLLYFIVVYS